MVLKHVARLNEWVEQMFSLPLPVRCTCSIIIPTNNNDDDDNFEMKMHVHTPKDTQRGEESMHLSV